MSVPAPNPATRSRWLDWEPKARIMGEPPESEPTKPTKPGFDGFVGAPPGPFQKIQNGQTGEAEPSQAAIDRSVSTLNAAGVRIWRDTSTFVIGTWSDLDGRDVRAALQTLGTGTLPVRHLEDPGVPLRFKLRSVPERTRNRPTTQSQR